MKTFVSIIQVAAIVSVAVCSCFITRATVMIYGNLSIPLLPWMLIATTAMVIFTDAYFNQIKKRMNDEKN